MYSILFIGRASVFVMPCFFFSLFSLKISHPYSVARALNFKVQQMNEKYIHSFSKQKKKKVLTLRVFFSFNFVK